MHRKLSPKTIAYLIALSVTSFGIFIMFQPPNLQATSFTNMGYVLYRYPKIAGLMLIFSGVLTYFIAKHLSNSALAAGMGMNKSSKGAKYERLAYFLELFGLTLLIAGCIHAAFFNELMIDKTTLNFVIPGLMITSIGILTSRVSLKAVLLNKTLAQIALAAGVSLWMFLAIAHIQSHYASGDIQISINNTQKFKLATIAAILTLSAISVLIIRKKTKF